MSIDKEFLAGVIEYYTPVHQLDIAIEEMSELTKEICKYKRGFDNRENIIEEMADVYIMLKQLQIIFNIEDYEIENIKNYKLERLKEFMDE